MSVFASMPSTESLPLLLFSAEMIELLEGEPGKENDEGQKESSENFGMRRK
jgi:hypothetical protein